MSKRYIVLPKTAKALSIETTAAGSFTMTIINNSVTIVTVKPGKDVLLIRIDEVKPDEVRV